MSKFYVNARYHIICGARLFAIAALFLAASMANAQVTVSGALVGNGPYVSLNAAFTAINGGVQTGAVISVSLSANTTEVSSAQLNAGVWTSLTVTATTPVQVSGTITGAIIRLNGADNVTIDGRIGGVGNNITVINNANVTATAAIWLSSTGVNAGATNNVIRNLNLSCGADQTTGTLSTFGIITSGAAATISSAGDDNDNNQFIFNNITKSRYGIKLRGATGNLNVNNVVSNNTIGSAALDLNRIGKVGVYIQFQDVCSISLNTIRNIGIQALAAETAGGADRVGIGLGSESWSSSPSNNTNTNITCTRNTISNIIEEKTFSAVGIAVSTTNGGSPTNNIVANNCISNVRANGTAGDCAAGIGISGGNGDFVVFNSVSILGDLDPGTASSTSQTAACLKIAGTPLNLSVRNNALYLDATSNTGTLNPVCIQVSSATLAFGTGALNNNDYFIPGTNTQARTGAIGTSSLATTFFATLANWQAALTPAQDAASVAVNPNFVDPFTNLHNNGILFNLDALAVPIVGVTVDIDGNLRNAVTPDIGCDEFASPPCAVADGGVASTLTPNICIGGNATISAAGTSGGTGTSFQWLVSSTSGSGYVPVSGGSGAATASYNTGALNTPGVFYYVLQTTCSNGPLTDLSNEVTLTVFNNAAHVSASDAVICNGETVTLTEDGGTGASWFWSTFAGTQSIVVSPITTTTYAVAVTSPGPCLSNANITIIVNQLPTGVVATASAANVCEGQTVDLFATGTSVAQQIVFSENFNGNLSAWTNINNSTLGIPANAAWTLRPSPHTYGVNTFNSNDFSQFVLSNSDSQGSGSNTSVQLISPAFSTLGSSSATVNFFHYFRNLNATDFPYVEASTDGLTWTILGTFETTQGAFSGFVPASLSLNAFANQATVYLRIRYEASWGWYWAIDNLTVTVPADLTWSWSSNPSGFTSTDQNPSGVVVNNTADYTVLATDINGCSISSLPVNVIADPAGCTDDQATNFDPLAICDDGSCVFVAGENPDNAVSASVAVYPACAGNTLDLSSYGPSGLAQTAAITGEDVWFTFVAPTSAASIHVVAGVNDIIIELQDAFGNLVDSENIVAGAGDEVLNISTLTPGDTYLIGVRNYDSNGGIGVFTLCTKSVTASTCDYGYGPYSLCGSYKADYVAANAYRFDFTSTTTLSTYTLTKIGSTFLQLNTVPGLTWQDIYDVEITAIFNIQDGLGNIDAVEVETLSPCQIEVIAQPLADLRAQDRCAAGPRFLGATVAATPHICGVVDYKWTFTRTDMAELPFVHYRGIANRFLKLSTVFGLTAGATYDVTVTPVFSYGEGIAGPVRCMSIVGPIMMAPQPDINGLERTVDNKNMTIDQLELGVYPNPNAGDMINVNFVGTEETVILVDIFDAMGKMLFSEQYTVSGSLNTIITFDQPLANGVYFVNFKLNDTIKTERLVVQH